MKKARKEQKNEVTFSEDWPERWNQSKDKWTKIIEVLKELRDDEEHELRYQHSRWEFISIHIKGTCGLCDTFLKGGYEAYYEYPYFHDADCCNSHFGESLVSVDPDTLAKLYNGLRWNERKWSEYVELAEKILDDIMNHNPDKE